MLKLKAKMQAVISRVDRVITLLERLADATEKLAARGPDRVIIHQDLPAPKTAPNPYPPQYPGISPYPFPQIPTYPGINPNNPGLGPIWTSQGPTSVTLTGTDSTASKPEPKPVHNETDQGTVFGLPVITDPRIQPGTAYFADPSKNDGPLMHSLLERYRRSMEKPLTEF